MKKENCPFCGHRWIRKSSENLIECPNCGTQYYVKSKQDDGYDDEPVEDEDGLANELEERVV